MRFGLEVRSGRPGTAEFGEELTQIIEREGGEVLTDPDQEPDLVVAVGGDGTMLAAVRRALEWDVPVLGFNLGTLGFLAEAEPWQAKEVIKRLLEEDYAIVERTTVAASIGTNTMTGVNDAVVEKIDSTRLISLNVVIDGTEFITYRADGLIFATPTGSTAYTFSAGGPLVDPRVPALVMTPVASHALFDRSIVLPADAVIEVTVASERLVRVNVDKTDLGELSEGGKVVVRRGERPARFVSFDSTTFPALVKDKFNLG